MVTHKYIDKRRAGNRHARAFGLALSTGTLIAAVFCAVVLFSSPALAQQRIVVEKATGNVVDAGDVTLKYDERRFDHLDEPTFPEARARYNCRV